MKTAQEIVNENISNLSPTDSYDLLSVLQSYVIYNNPIESLRKLGDKAPTLFCITTGAGAGLQKYIWEIPGISNFFIGSQMPYDMDETAKVLGFKPDKFVSNETAIDLAITAYLKALRPNRSAIGLGMTCSVSSVKEHRGDHKIIVAAVTNDNCYLILI